MFPSAFFAPVFFAPRFWERPTAPTPSVTFLRGGTGPGTFNVALRIRIG
jgi:hypothetical protein